MKIARLLIAAALALGSAPACAATLTVFAAASLREALDEAARAFERASGHAVRVSYGASSALARQIEAGAPAQLFISADEDWMDYLSARGLLAPPRVRLLANSLVLIAPAGRAPRLRIAPGFALAAALGTGRLALADPRAVPAGKYARAALESLRTWDAVRDRLAPAESVRAALALVARGEAPLGIVYRTDALADKGVRIVDTFPAGTHPDIVYPAALVAGARSPAAAALLAFLRGPASRATWTRHGFGLGPVP